MKRTTLAAFSAALAIVGSPASAATFEVPMSGTYTLTLFEPIDSECGADYCVKTTDLAGTFMRVTTPEGDGVFTDGVSVSYRFTSDLPTSPDIYGFSSSSTPWHTSGSYDAAIVKDGKLVSLIVQGDDASQELTIEDGAFDWYTDATHNSATASGSYLLVPEPSALSLLAVGALGLMLRRSGRGSRGRSSPSSTASSRCSRLPPGQDATAAEVPLEKADRAAG